MYPLLFKFKHLQGALVENLSQMTPAAYLELCSLIYQTPFSLSSKRFYKPPKMLSFVNYVVHIHRLCILVKIVWQFPLLQLLQNIDKRTQQNNDIKIYKDIFLKTLKELKQWKGRNNETVYIICTCSTF